MDSSQIPAANIHWNRPLPIETKTTYKAPPKPSNPVVRGSLLHYGANIISSSSFVSNYLYANTGWSKVLALKELESVEPRYDPTVIPSAHDSNESSGGPLRLEDLASIGPFHSIADYNAAYVSGALTPAAVVEALLPLILRDAEKPTRHSIAFMETRVELVRKAAEESTGRYKAGKPLSVIDGVPIAIKDEVDLAGYRKTLGTKRDYTSKEPQTSFCVQKWIDAGAVMLGKLSMHELGLDTTNNNPNYETPLNPFNSHYYTGGSSGGSGYAVGVGLIPFALGADGGGSIRIPANYCGVYGLKTSHGRVSGKPTVSLAASTGVLGPIAGTMTDLAIAYRIMATPDPQHISSALFPAPSRPLQPVNKKVLGIYKHWIDRADEPVRQLFQATIDHLVSKKGYTTVDISIPYIHEGQAAHSVTILSEIGTSFADVSGLTPANQTLISVGRHAPTSDFLNAQKLRNLILNHLSFLFAQHPGLIIVTPTTPNAGWHISGGKGDLKFGISDGNMSIRNMEYVWLANFCGLPSLTFPVGYVDPLEGEAQVPVGLMGNAEWGAEDALIEFGFDGEAYLNGESGSGRRKPEGWVDVLELAKAGSAGSATVEGNGV